MPRATHPALICGSKKGGPVQKSRGKNPPTGWRPRPAVLSDCSSGRKVWSDFSSEEASAGGDLTPLESAPQNQNPPAD